MAAPCTEMELLGDDSSPCKGERSPRAPQAGISSFMPGEGTVTGPARLCGFTLLPAKVLPTTPRDPAARHPEERREEEALIPRDVSPSINRVQSNDFCHQSSPKVTGESSRRAVGRGAPEDTSGQG